MSLSLLDIYNRVTGQSWSIYETDLTENDEIEKSVIISIQKALRLLWNAHDYCFRLKNKTIITVPNETFYARPEGNIIKKGVKNVVNNRILHPVHHTDIIDTITGEPLNFYIKYNKLGLYPVPNKQYTISVDYNTFKLGKNSQGLSIYNLNELSDTLDVPEMYEDLFLHALINKSMVNALASGKSELYYPYLQQFLDSYKNLIRNTLGVEIQKEIKW